MLLEEGPAAVERLAAAVAAETEAGQQRRLAIARLLVTEANFWILDEPFTSLDRQGIETVEGLFDAHLAGGGMAALTTHHRIDLAHAQVHRINLSS